MGRIRRDWSRLPEHLLASIAELLHTRIDILRFRAVCRSFRTTLPPPSKLLFSHPVLTANDFLRGPQDPRNNEPFALIESTVYAIQPVNEIFDTEDNETSQTWLIKVQESKPGTVRIMDPLSGFRSKQLPSSLNLLDYRVTEISKSYVVESSMKSLLRQNVVFSSLLDETTDGFAAMTRYDCGSKLGIWKNVDKKWISIDIGLKFPLFFENIIYHNRKFYAVIPTGHTITVDSESLMVTHAAAGLQLNPELSLLYLVESFKDLLLIVQYKEKDEDTEYYIKVFKLDEEKRQWIPSVDGLELEDRVFFVGEEGSYSVSASEFSGCKGNCVYFTADNLDNNLEFTCEYPGQYTWICDLKGGTVGHLSDFPGYSNLFWPPPTW